MTNFFFNFLDCFKSGLSKWRTLYGVIKMTNTGLSKWRTSGELSKWRTFLWKWRTFFYQNDEFRLSKWRTLFYQNDELRFSALSKWRTFEGLIVIDEISPFGYSCIRMSHLRRIVYPKIFFRIRLTQKCLMQYHRQRKWHWTEWQKLEWLINSC